MEQGYLLMTDYMIIWCDRTVVWMVGGDHAIIYSETSKKYLVKYTLLSDLWVSYGCIKQESRY